ncbi:hypothetical protein [Alicyclobacillus fodiniaquatilis]|uniref:Uncharacterized protein n=1 Tax=Alicyclobacillus fodiniaquatilis TaxID=1661150 RepID=A0ABW4JIX3_9BACL
MKCPECGSEHCQRYEVINAYGTSMTHSTGVGVGIGSSGVGLGVGRTRGVNTTKMGALTDPPRQLGYRRSIFFLIVWCFIGFGMLNDKLLTGGFFFLACAIVPALTILRRMNYNTKRWPVLYEEWKQKWFCNQCGHSFVDEK